MVTFGFSIFLCLILLLVGIGVTCANYFKKKIGKAGLIGMVSMAFGVIVLTMLLAEANELMLRTRSAEAFSRKARDRAVDCGLAQRRPDGRVTFADPKLEYVVTGHDFTGLAHDGR
jgi:hypothetical protein